MLIDTHKAVRDLTEVGVPQEQAERFVDVVTRADDKVATKADIERLEERLTSRMDGMDARFDGIDARLDGIDTRLDGIDARLDGVDLQLNGLRSELDGKPSYADLERVKWQVVVFTTSAVAGLLAIFEFLL